MELSRPFFVAPRQSFSETLLWRRSGCHDSTCCDLGLRGEHGEVREGLQVLSGRARPDLASGKHDRSRPHPVEIWIVDAGRNDPVIAKGFGSVKQAAPNLDDHRVARAQV